MTTPTITVHHLEQSRSHRVLWMLEELGATYELVTYPRNPQSFRADPALRQIHPLGKSPVIVVGDDVLFESGAILEHLSDLHEGRLRPDPGTPEHLRYRALLHFAEGSVMPSLLVRLILDRLRSAPLPFFVKPIAKKIAGNIDELFTQPEIDLHTSFLEGLLSDGDWFAGSELTAADIQLSYPVEAALLRGRIAPNGVPRLRAWLERIRARPAFQRALDKGGEPFPTR